MSASLADKMKLFRALLADPALPALAKCVGSALILRFHNNDTGRCDPSYEQLGEACGVKKRATILAVQDLEAGGWLAVERRGHHRPNSFGLAFDRVPEVHDHAPQDEDLEVHAYAPQDGSEVHDHAPHNVSEVHGSVVRGAQVCTQTTKNTPRLSDVGERVPTRAPGGRGFEDFWRAYPKHVGHAKARDAFERMVASGRATAEVLIAGAERYAAERASQEPRFTKTPANWLEGEHWLDEPASPRASGASGDRSAPFSFMDYAKQTVGRSSR